MTHAAARLLRVAGEPKRALVTCSSCAWAYFPGDWPDGPGPIVALLDHTSRAHPGRFPRKETTG